MDFTFGRPAYLIVLVFLVRLVSSLRQSKSRSELKPAPKFQALSFSKNLYFDKKSIQFASVDYGHMVHKKPAAVLRPFSVQDIIGLVSFSYKSAVPLTIAPRGRGHSVHGQSMAPNGVVVDMMALRCSRNADGSGVKVSWSQALGHYADVGGDQLWVDVLTETLKSGLAPVSWTDYLYLTVGGTLSNAGISGQSFRYGPQISNVHEMDVITGRGDLVTCSPQRDSELFFAVLGGLGQFGIVTRARVRLDHAPETVKWIRMLYTDFAAFSADQERLISENSEAIDYIEGSIFIGNGAPNEWRSSFYSSADAERITLLSRRHGIFYSLEIAQYYTNDQSIEKLLHELRFSEGLCFRKSVGFVEFLDRVKGGEMKLRSQGLWNVPHPWLNLFVPKSRILDFHNGAVKNIVLMSNVPSGVILFYPMRRDKWDDRTSAVIPEEETFYSVLFLHSSTLENRHLYDKLNKDIMLFCEKACIVFKQYMPYYESHDQWAKHFGIKWPAFVRRKFMFDPKFLLSPGQRIFTR